MSNIEIAIKRFFNKKVSQLGIEFYSLLIINELASTQLYSNMSKFWIEDFIQNKMNLNSDIVIKSHHKLSPFFWTIDDVKNTKLKLLAAKYTITMGATFPIHMGNYSFLFSIYEQCPKEVFFGKFKRYKSEIQLDLLTFFEDKLFNKNSIYFTPRESDVMNLLKIGRTYEEIAELLKITERTVRYHLDNIANKLQVSSIKHAIFRATKLGLI